MTQLQSLGAINIHTNKYTHPVEAQKNKQYKCPDCDEKVILKKGKIRRVHFAHYSESDSGCTYYSNHPSESQLHNDAKMRLAEILKKKLNIVLTSESGCEKKYCGRFIDININYQDGDEIVVEYRDPKKKYVADIAVINSGKPRYIFEIKHTHGTQTDRPSPWFEINADEVINVIDNYYLSDESDSGSLDSDSSDDEKLHFVLIGGEFNNVCETCRITDQKWVRNIPQLISRAGADKKWKQEQKCFGCGRNKYNPIYNSGYRAMCKLCIACDTEEIKKKFISAQTDLFID